MGDAPVVPYTGLDSAMAHDQKMLAEIDAQHAAGVPVGQARASAPLRMPGQFDAIFDGVAKARGGKPAADFSEETLRNLDLVYEELETQPPASATIINFHPIVIRVNGGRNYYQSVPPCTPDLSLRPMGRQCTSLVIGDAAIDPVPQESGNHTFNKIFPLWMAQNYMNVANSNDQLWGPGSFIYEGDLSPEEMWEQNPLIKTFTDAGMPILTEVDAVINSRRAGGMVNGKKRMPVMAHYRDVYTAMFNRRNQAYFDIVRKVDSEYHQKGPEERKNVGINGVTRDQAQVCLNLGLLLKAPDWLTPSRLDAGIAAEKCSNCKGDVSLGAVMCPHCNEPVDPFQAFIDGKIDVEHLALTTLDDEKLTEVYRVDYERKEKIKRAKQAAGNLRRKEGQQGS
jgi:hypothetical protein